MWETPHRLTDHESTDESTDWGIASNSGPHLCKNDRGSGRPGAAGSQRMEHAERLPQTEAPTSETPETQLASTSSELHRRRSHRRGRSRNELHDRIEVLEKQRLLLSVASGALAVLGLGLGVGLFLTHSAASDARAASDAQRGRLELGMRESAAQLAVVQHNLREAQERVAELVNERLPGLGALVLGRPIPIGQHFIRDITFDEVRDATREGIEYKLVIENTSSSPIKPDLSVQLFDAVGVQLGSSRPIEMRGDEAPLLRAGEIRSYFAVFDPPGSKLPAYFRIIASR